MDLLLKTGKILQKFNVENRFITSTNICLVPVLDNNKVKYSENILMANSSNIFCLEFN